MGVSTPPPLHAACCITKMTWTVLNLLTWPSIWVSMGTSQTTRGGEEVHAKVFKLLINHIHRTFHAHHLNLTERWMYTIEIIFLDWLFVKKKAVTCFKFFVVQPAALLQQFASSVCFLKILQWLRGCMKLHLQSTLSKNVDSFIHFSCLCLYLGVNLLCNC